MRKGFSLFEFLAFCALLLAASTILLPRALEPRRALNEEQVVGYLAMIGAAEVVWTEQVHNYVTLQRLAESGPPRGAGPSGAQPPLIPPDFLFDGSGIGHRGGYRFRVGLDEDERITGCWAWPNLDGYSGENTYWTNFRERTVQRAHLRASWKNQPPGTAPAASDLEGTALATY